jgi:hypothetical protein
MRKNIKYWLYLGFTLLPLLGMFLGYVSMAYGIGLGFDQGQGGDRAFSDLGEMLLMLFSLGSFAILFCVGVYYCFVHRRDLLLKYLLGVGAFALIGIAVTVYIDRDYSRRDAQRLAEFTDWLKTAQTKNHAFNSGDYHFNFSTTDKDRENHTIHVDQIPVGVRVYSAKTPTQFDQLSAFIIPDGSPLEVYIGKIEGGCTLIPESRILSSYEVKSLFCHQTAVLKDLDVTYSQKDLELYFIKPFEGAAYYYVLSLRLNKDSIPGEVPPLPSEPISSVFTPTVKSWFETVEFSEKSKPPESKKE